MSNTGSPRPGSEREEALFAAALQRPSSERVAFLDGACHGDAALRARLEALLAAHEQPDRLLQDNADSPAAPTMKSEFVEEMKDEDVGQKIGRYKILERVGEGGCGVVYVAEQTEPVRRRVALKVIKLGMDTKQVVARFEAERQALAMMDHPNIAKVHDAGTTDTGRPYFVMELVRGIRITDYCDQNNLSTQERLDLFIKVCHAIQHAHQKGIIHRDIKPSNILVTLHDGVPVPKVIDFGIAKATEGRLTDATVYTQLHQFIGTPAYMSPEQAEMSGLDIDTRSDIYSLGVLLYELLTGKTPFDAQILMSQGIDAMRKTIREQEPVRPSTKLATLKGEELTTTAKRRSVEASRLAYLLRGDLDWIAMKCLEKDRTRRYETANGLAADLKRHLQHEPVVARPPSTAYRLQKAWHRNKAVYTAALLVAMVLVIGASISVLQAAHATRARNRALQAELEKQEEARTARQERDAARAATARAEQERLRADAEAEANRRNLYAADMRATQLALHNLDYGVARQLLDRHRPTGNQKDLRCYVWRLLWQQSQGDQLLTIPAHSDPISCVTFSPDGKYVLSASRDGTVAVTDLGLETIAQSWRVDSRGINSVSISPDARLLATGGSDGTIKLWKWPGTTLISTLQVRGAYAVFAAFGTTLYVGGGPNSKRGPSEGVKAVRLGSSFAPENVVDLSADQAAFPAPNRDGSLLAIGSTRRDVQLTDANGRVLRSIEESAGALSLAFSPDSTLLAVCSGNYGQRPENEIRIHDPSTGRLLMRLTNNTGRVWSLSFSPDGRLLAGASSDQTVRLWDVATWQEIQRLRGHGSEIWAVAFSPDGRSLASGSKDTTVRLWQTQPSNSTNRIGNTRVYYGQSPKGVFLNRETLFAANMAKPFEHVGIWSVSTGRLLRELTNEVLCLGENEDRRAILTISREPPYVLRSWDTQEFRLLREVALPKEASSIDSACLSHDRRSVILHQAETVFEIDCTTGHPRQSFLLSPGIGSELAKLSPDRSMWAAISMRQAAPSLALFPSSALERISEFAGHRDQVFSLEFSPNESVVATASIDNTARLWEWPSGRLIAVLAGHKEGLFDCSFSPDGAILATASGDKTVRLWHVATRREMIALPHDRPVTVCSFSPEGNYLAAGTVDNVYRFWRAANWEEINAAEAKEKARMKQP